MSDQERGYAFDRRISLAIVLALVLEATGALLWTGAAAERIDQLEGGLAQSSLANERLARLEEQTAAMRTQLDRIEARFTQR